MLRMPRLPSCCAVTCCVVLCFSLQRLGRENAALLARAGVDDLGDLTTTDLNLPTADQQQGEGQDAAGSTTAAAVARSAATPDVPSTEIAVEALSVRNLPLSQPQQQQAADDEEEWPEEFQEWARLLEGAAEWGNKQEKMAAALSKLGAHMPPCLEGGVGLRGGASMSW